MRNRVKSSRPQAYRRFWTTQLNEVERQSLGRLAASTRPAARRRCRDWIEIVIDSPTFACDPEAADLVVELLEKLAHDGCDTIRSRALFQLGALVQQWHEKVWPVAERLAHDADSTLAELVPSFILEHLLQYQFDTYFPRVREAIEAGDRRMAEMLDGCYLFGQAEPHENEMAALLRKQGIEPRFVREDNTDQDRG